MAWPAMDMFFLTEYVNYVSYILLNNYRQYVFQKLIAIAYFKRNKTVTIIIVAAGMMIDSELL